MFLTILPYVKFAQFRNALGGTIKCFSYYFALCFPPEFRNAMFTALKSVIIIILPYVNFDQFRNALRGTRTYYSYYFASYDCCRKFETRLFTTLTYVSPGFALCEFCLISKHDFHYTKIFYYEFALCEF